MHLLTRAHAAQYWGWRNAMSFVTCDEYLHDLLRYATHHRSNGWHIRPSFRRLYHTDDAIARTVHLVLRPHTPSLHSAWHMYWKVDTGPLLDSQHVFRLVVRFAPLDESDPLTAYIHHMQTDPWCAFARPAERFYYVHVHDWVARCAEPCEVVALLNAIQRNAPRIQSEHARRSHECALFAHLESTLGSLDHDTPRRLYVQRTMDRLESGWRDFTTECAGVNGARLI
jgi:hypothetical protein